MIENVIYARLTGAAGFTALCGTRVTPVDAPLGQALPYVTYQQVSGPRIRSTSGASGGAMPRVQIDCWGGTYTSARAVAKQVRLALDNFRGTAGGVTVRAASLESELDLKDTEVEPKLFRVSLDFFFHIDE